MNPSRTKPATPLDGSEMSLGIFGTRKTLYQLLALGCVGLTIWVWLSVFASHTTESAVYFLDVGQGDAQLVVLVDETTDSDIRILIDAGRGKAVLNALDAALSGGDKYIDIILMTHPHLDHYEGFVEVVRRYDVGLFVHNGHTADTSAFEALHQTLQEHGVPALVLLEGDDLRYGNHTMTVLSPDHSLLHGDDVDEASIVTLLTADSGTRVLFVGDAGTPTETALIEKGHTLASDVLKVGHHGSNNSTSERFAAVVRPRISVIGVGDNHYGHPAKRVLETLELAGSVVYTTQEHGTIKIPLSPEAAPIDPSRTGTLATAQAILTGTYKEPSVRTVTLSETPDRAFLLTPVTSCSFDTSQKPAHSPVIMNEVAWMGSQGGSTHEWMELKNTSGEPLSIAGWQVINANENVHVTFPQQTMFTDRFFVLARRAADEALSLSTDVLFTGAIRNSNEGLRLYDNECNLIDEIFASPQWPAGDNTSKRTMERAHDLTWNTSRYIEGTPRSEN